MGASAWSGEDKYGQLLFLLSLVMIVFDAIFDRTFSKLFPNLKKMMVALRTVFYGA